MKSPFITKLPPPQN